jgi:nitrogenase-associated protein
MCTVIFYEKPGCQNNAKQKVLLAAAGHTVWAKNLLTERWTAAKLRPFFGNLPVAQWFNPSAPRIRDGLLDYRRLTETEALLQMLADPLLIRRPLMEVAGECRVGFDQSEVDAWIGLMSKSPNIDLETCPKGHQAQPCPMPDGS